MTDLIWHSAGVKTRVAGMAVVSAINFSNIYITLLPTNVS